MFIKISGSGKKGEELKYKTVSIAESKRDERGVPRHKYLLHLGSYDKFIKSDLDSLLGGLLKIKGVTLEDVTEQFDSCKAIGQIWAFMKIWSQLKITQSVARLKKGTKIEFDLEAHLKALVFNRLDDPGSKLRLISWLETVYIPGLPTEDIRYENLLRAMDFLIAHKKEIEEDIAKEYLAVFDTSVELCFYDITSTYFEAESSIGEYDIRKNGYSRDNRPDKKQIVIGVVMTQDGIPIAHYTFDGNTVDSKTVRPVLEDIKKRFNVETITLVADKGMSSGSNLKSLIDNGDDFILGESARASSIGKETIALAVAEKEQIAPQADEYIFDTVLPKKIGYTESTPSGHRSVKHIVKEVRCVASYNRNVACKRKRTRQENFAKAYDYVSQVNRKNISIDDKYSDIKNFLRNKHLTRFFKILRTDDTIEIEQIEESVRNEEKSDGWFMVITLNRELSKETIIEKYKELKYVEHGFYELKHSLKLRPNYHWTERRIKAHVMICFIAFQMACLLERKIKSSEQSWEKCVSKLRRIQVVEWTTKDRTRQGLTKPTYEQQEIFDLIGCPKLSINKL